MNEEGARKAAANRRRPSVPSGFPLRSELTGAERAVSDLRRGAFIVVTGPDGTYLLQAAELLDEASLGWGYRYAGGPPMLVITSQRAAALGLTLPRADTRTPVLLSLREPISASWLRQLFDPTETLGGGPSVEAEGAVQMDGSQALAAALRLVRSARLLPALLAWSLTGQAGELSDERGLTLVDAESDLSEPMTRLTAVTEAQVPLLGAEQTRIVAFRPADGGDEHLAIIVGALDPAVPTLVRIHSECFTGDLLGSLRCDCGDQLRGAIAEMGRRGSGILLYLAQEGRGIGLVNKLRAYQLQDAGADTLEANEQLGFDADERDFSPAVEMLRQLGVGAVRLMTNNPAKVAALETHGIAVLERVAHSFAANDHNHRYLETKARRAGHLF